MVGRNVESTGAPTTSLIVSTRNRPELVWDVVRSVLDGEMLPTELLVVDQSDTAQTDFVERPPETTVRLRYLWNPARGLSRGRNTGIAAATSDILVFLDDDVLVPTAWFATIVGALTRAGPRAVITGRVLSGSRRSPGVSRPR
jgi:glycosyltransferase involved in cell wall biosynthesis